MSLFAKTPTPPAAETPPAADPPVSRSEFNSLDSSIRAMAESIRDLALRPVVVQAPTAPEVAVPDITDAELDTAISEGRGAATIKEILARESSKLKREAAAEIGAVREYGTAMLGTLAERSAVGNLEHFKRFEKEIRGLVNQCEPALRGHPQTWETAYHTIVGQHEKELRDEAVEAEMRRRAAEADAAASAPQPGSRTGSPRGGTVADDSIPTLHELAGADFAAASLGDMSEEDFIKRMNRGKPARLKYKDWNDYVSRGKAIDEGLAAIRSGLTDNGDEPIPKSLQ